MGRFQQKSFNEFILENRVLGFFENPITLKSGRQSYWYVNWRSVAEDAWLLDRLTEYVIAFTEDCLACGRLPQLPDCFYGVPEGATKLAIITQYKWAKSRPSFGLGSHVVPMGRAKPKDHGVPKDKFFVGAPRGLTIVLEDVTTTGGSLLSSIDGLVESDIPVMAAFGLTNRMEKRDDGQGVAQAIAAKTSNLGPIHYLHLSNAMELLPLAVRRFSPPAAVVEAIVEEFKKYGEEPIVL